MEGIILFNTKVVKMLENLFFLEFVYFFWKNFSFNFNPEILTYFKFTF